MLKHFLVVTIRNLQRDIGYTLVNVMGLGTGIAVSLLLFFWVRNELSYDRFHADAERIYQVAFNFPEENGELSTWITAPIAFAEKINEEIPEAEAALSVTYPKEISFIRGQEPFLGEGVYAGNAFPDVFNFPLLEGHKESLFSKPNDIVLTETLAEKFFGSGWRGQTVGKTLEAAGEESYTVSGVMAAPPANSTLQFDFLLSMEDYLRQRPWEKHWGNFSSRLYVKVKPGTDIPALENKLISLFHNNKDDEEDTTISLLSFPGRHLYSKLENGRPVGGRITYVRLFIGAAAFLLLIACINFMNLATARATRRSREIGVRKVVGASRGQLAWQFLSEAVAIALVATGVGIVLIELLKGPFRQITGTELSINYLEPGTLSLILGTGLVAGLLSGSYPAFLLSSFRAVNIFRGKEAGQFSGASLRKGLVVLQFLLSACLIVCAFGVHQQVNYIMHKNLGLDRENVVRIPMNGALYDKYPNLKDEISAIPGVKQFAASNQTPFMINSETRDPVWAGKAPDNQTGFRVMEVTNGFLETMGIEIAAGRDFSPDRPADTLSLVINETAARAMGMGQPLGQKVEFWGVTGQIIGVAKDFHVNSLHSSIAPLILYLSRSGSSDNLYVRTAAGQTRQAMLGLEALYKRVVPDYPFGYSFLDEEYSRLYRSEMAIGKLAFYFAFIAILLSCIGLFGLSAFTAARRTREIGIRKVVGASVANIVNLLFKDFLKLILIGFVISVPVAWYLLTAWLDSFAYQTGIGASMFLATAGLMVLVAWLAVSYHSIRAAMANPVEALGSE
ncbi:MAG: ABC transporter permease [Phaeodactylibacter sp.]|nr:ABC transporter permease [Phaeodactylibacter sp.]MCB9264181.1 ABC transporter permease [Lewinellaceae bacterium]MCB9286801.1 ABC transporter permease [Lewinellaceae bacterium]